MKDDNNLRNLNYDIDIEKNDLKIKIDNFLKNIKINNVKFEILLNYEKSKNNISEFSSCYKEQMRNLVYLILTNIRPNNDMDGNKLIKIINEFIEIFNHSENIETIKNEENPLNSILVSTFKQKIQNFYITLLNKINSIDKSIIMNQQSFKNYLTNIIKNELKDFWPFYYDSIKNEIDNEIEKLAQQLSIDSKSVKEIIPQNKPIDKPIYFPIPTPKPGYNIEKSIVDSLKSIGYSGNLEYRKLIGEKNGFIERLGTMEYNIHMLDLLKKGKLLIP